MNQRSFTAAIIIAALLGALLYIWQPWSATPSLRLGLDLQGGLRVVLQADQANPTSEEMQTARSVIENRVNQFGVSEPVIQTSGKNRIIVELPGLSQADQKRALSLIGEQAVLQFRLVKPEAAQKSDQDMTLDDLEKVAFTGKILSSAQASFNHVGGTTLGGAVVLFTVKNKYAKDFGNFTGGNLGRRMAIVLDGKVISAPTLQGRITTDGQITGMKNLDEASNLALVLRSGSLPISLHVEEIRAVGPTLGQDSINAGELAALLGLLIVVIIILLYYGPLFGGALTIGLLYAGALVLGGLSILHAVLTLPGLAGLVLTIGTVVDGNVISFERVKEELRKGKSIRLSMRDGLHKSLNPIIDSNISIILAALALYQYTTGPVRGFAITLAIGVVVALFVNTVVVHFLLDVASFRIRRTFMPHGVWFHGLKFVRLAPIVMTTSAILAAVALGFVFTKGLNPSTDFTGGSDVLLSVNQQTTVNDVRSAISKLDIPGITGGEAVVQEITNPTGAAREISVKVGLTQKQASQGGSEAFATALAQAVNGKVLQTSFVGPSVGKDLRNSAFLAAIIAILLILAYIGIRFWPDWVIAVAIILATVHDVGIVLGVMAVIHAEFSIPVLAAVLFVIGHSMNDSIIIADRIRENLRTTRDTHFADIVDLAINQTMARTVMTQGLAFLPVLSLFFFGGSVIHDFSTAILVGIFFGTYSSVFIVSPIVVWFRNRRQKSKNTRGHRRTA
jgi:SecD/SecF fusion protein